MQVSRADANRAVITRLCWQLRTFAGLKAGQAARNARQHPVVGRQHRRQAHTTQSCSIERQCCSSER